MVASRLAVVGGSGFLGSHVCRLAVQSGLSVVSVSRSGTAPTHSSKEPHHYSSLVAYKACDVLSDAAGLEECLAGCDSLVITVGALLQQSNYKTLSTIGSGGGGSGSQATGSHDVENRDTVLRVMDAVARRPEIRSVVFVSAGNVLGPLHALNDGYLRSKRQAEEVVLAPETLLGNATVLRPGIMYSDSRPVSMIASGAVTAKRALLGGLTPDWMMQDEPLPVETVAAACVQIVKQQASGGKCEWETIMGVEGIKSMAGSCHQHNHAHA